MNKIKAHMTYRKLGFIQCYFGQWPTYWDFFAISAAANPHIMFFIITNLKEPDYVPPNIVIVSMTLTEVLDRLSRVVGFTLNILGFHKLCDFRPFYGLAFSDIIQSFDYWGYCDMDIMFGDLTPLQIAAQTNVDLISPWTYTVGHCTLVRNDTKVNNMAFKIPNIEQRYSKVESTFSDEGAFFEACVIDGGLSFCGVNSISKEWSKQKCFLGATIKPPSLIWGMEDIKQFAITCEEKRITVRTSDGKTREMLYFHFMAAKAKRFWRGLKGKRCLPVSFAPFGYLPYKAEANELQTPYYKMRSAASRFRSNAYRVPRELMPKKTVEVLKRLRSKIRGIQRT